ncbi:MAG: Hsp20/alpha crystallin family protein [Alicyclobacillaceae bacterium]|nr:Hsp20/alpha crystallin family protein [Alicyclobacillaceae bacterium]
MPLIPYDPFHLLRRDTHPAPWFGRWFDDDWTTTLRPTLPRVDVRETATDVIVTAEIPGLESKDDVNITVHDNHLHLYGRINRTVERQGENVYHSERYFGQFSRTIPLPAAVDENRAKATYRNGILEVTIPKAERQAGRRIDVDFH